MPRIGSGQNNVFPGVHTNPENVCKPPVTSSAGEDQRQLLAGS